MHPVSLDAALIRLQLPELVLKEGMSVVARVASRGEGAKGALILAGQLLKASLPDGVRAGDTLRLAVSEISPERVVLQLVERTPAEPGQQAQAQPQAQAQAQAQAQMPTALPGLAPPPAQNELRDADPDGGEGGRREGGGDGRSGVSLVYETPRLGRLDLRIDRGPEGVVATIGVPAGAHALAHARAETLRQALEARTGVPAVVRIAARREPFDAYA
ncbi:MAG: hypothetical protein AVDCRST_MAG45-1558 [uncultured Solirubrobacterales bacterium]|uniref:Flagellar hook-length control protein-like C-terminal domain-containing protein n=1 Tax=uncultured Solirubrobacterales bacterium TaxID=768556 RepID=A0A6J4STP0_9ACTN|nr:MAG: hypothetical protein AVDCRST_MAG45-1558 [uncultured Solirubrobacterales bacterium]